MAIFAQVTENECIMERHLRIMSKWLKIALKRIRGFGDDALYKFTFYITLQWTGH